jgi:hypothetical protein
MCLHLEKTQLTFTAILCMCAWVLGSGIALAADQSNSGSLVGKSSVPQARYVGLRRSSYGLRKLNADDVWWADRAKQFAANFPGSQPLILHILSNYQDDGTTQIEFKKPEAYHGPTNNMSFLPRGKLNHERALTTYDEMGVKAILQFEPGSAEVGDCFELARVAFGWHPCVIGMAIDGEWFRTKDSKDKTGLPVSDSDAKRWMERVLKFNSEWILVLKHFEAEHLPQNYRHPHLWFLTDSQEFSTRADWIADMRAWAASFSGAPIGSQYGYPHDQRWWGKTPVPPVDLGRTLCSEIPDYRMLLWVDFSADRTSFNSDQK